MYSNCKQHWRLRKFVSWNLGSLVHCMGCWHIGMSHSIQEDLGGLGYLSFQDDQEDLEDLWNLWTLVDQFLILLVDLGGQAALEVLEIQYPFHLSLPANLVLPGAPASLVFLGSQAAHQVLVLLWLLGGPLGSTFNLRVLPFIISTQSRLRWGAEEGSPDRPTHRSRPWPPIHVFLDLLSFSVTASRLSKHPPGEELPQIPGSPPGPLFSLGSWPSNSSLSCQPSYYLQASI